MEWLLSFGNAPNDMDVRTRMIEHDRLVPITVPLPGWVTDHLVGVTTDDAYLPLALACLERIRHLWDIIAGRSYFNMRMNGDDLLFEVLRRSFITMLEAGDVPAVAQDEIAQHLPNELPPHADLIAFDEELGAFIADEFQAVRSVLLTEALARGITSDTRTVDGAFRRIDAHLDAMSLVRNRGALKEGERLGLPAAWQAHLRKTIRAEETRIRGFPPLNLGLAMAVLDRIEAMWTLLYPRTQPLTRYAGDEHVYQAYRATLLQLLKDDRDYHPVRHLAGEQLPRLLPNAAELSWRNRLFGEMSGRFAHLRAEIVALGSRLEEPTTLSGIVGLELAQVYEQDEWAWTALQKTITQTREHQAQVSPRPRPRTRRKQAALTHAQAVHEWRAQREGLDGANPTRKEFCQYLVTQGYLVSTRTLRRREQEWEQAGLTFPPAEETD